MNTSPMASSISSRPSRRRSPDPYRAVMPRRRVLRFFRHRAYHFEPTATGIHRGLPDSGAFITRFMTPCMTGTRVRSLADAFPRASTSRQYLKRTQARSRMKALKLWAFPYDEKLDSATSMSEMLLAVAAATGAAAGAHGRNGRADGDRVRGVAMRPASGTTIDAYSGGASTHRFNMSVALPKPIGSRAARSGISGAMSTGAAGHPANRSCSTAPGTTARASSR